MRPTPFPRRCEAGSLIVVCSPNGAASPWVQKKIEFFRQTPQRKLRRHRRLYSLLRLNSRRGANARRALRSLCARPQALGTHWGFSAGSFLPRSE